MAASSAPTAPIPRPTQAPEVEEMSELPPTAASPSPVYSPMTVNSSGEAADSSSSESFVIPNLLELTPSQALEELFKPECPELTPDSTNQCWTCDSELQSYTMFSPTW
eukprot:1696044-Amphidinium_carterae.1